MNISHPAFEIITEGTHIKIWADGKIEGISGTVINRIPRIILEVAMGEALDKMSKELSTEAMS